MRQHSGNVSKKEWMQAFRDMDTDGGTSPTAHPVPPESSCVECRWRGEQAGVGGYVWATTIDVQVARHPRCSILGESPYLGIRFWDEDGSGAIDAEEWKRIYKTRKGPNQQQMQQKSRRGSNQSTSRRASQAGRKKAWFDGPANTVADHHAPAELDSMLSRIKSR